MFMGIPNVVSDVIKIIAFLKVAVCPSLIKLSFNLHYTDVASEKRKIITLLLIVVSM